MEGMMKNQTILVLQGPNGTAHDLGYLAEVVRKKHAHLSVLHIGAVQPIPVYAYGGMPYGAVEIPSSWVTERQELTQTLEELRQHSNDFFKTQGISGEAGVICSFPGSLDEDIAARALLCDIAVVHSDLRENEDVFNRALYGLLFQSPVGVIINPDQSTAPLTPRHVFIAWNNSKPAARAVHAALPMLLASEKVSIGTFDADGHTGEDLQDPGADVAKWLSHHGCNVTLHQYQTLGMELGEAIRLQAGQLGADLVVMGAFGHSRMRQAVFGGTTRSMIAQQTAAVFMAH